MQSCTGTGQVHTKAGRKQGLGWQRQEREKRSQLWATLTLSLSLKVSRSEVVILKLGRMPPCPQYPSKEPLKPFGRELFLETRSTGVYMLEKVEPDLSREKVTGKRYFLEGKCIYSFYSLSTFC